MKAMIPLALAAFGVLAACSSSSGKSNGNCSDINSAKSLDIMFTLVSNGSTPGCLASYDYKTGEDAGGGGGSDAGGPCAPVVNGCTATIDCSPGSTAGVMETIKATLTATGNSFSGTGSISITSIGMCNYNLTGTYE